MKSPYLHTHTVLGWIDGKDPLWRSTCCWTMSDFQHQMIKFYRVYWGLDMYGRGGYRVWWYTFERVPYHPLQVNSWWRGMCKSCHHANKTQILLKEAENTRLLKNPTARLLLVELHITVEDICWRKELNMLGAGSQVSRSCITWRLSSLQRAGVSSSGLELSWRGLWRSKRGRNEVSDEHMTEDQEEADQNLI
jgi:hypothetical protein